MARVEGNAGRYVKLELSRKLNLYISGIYIVSVVFALFGGFMLAKTVLVAIPTILVVEGILFLVGKRVLEKAEKEMAAWKRGLEGEVIVGRTLAEDLPDSFRIIHDLNTQFGNMDHVVIGPTGVFAVETKNWRGMVTSDGSGELLLNGNPTDKTFVKNFTRTIMSIREKLNVLAPTDRFIQGVMVFPSAYEDAKWGTTGNVHCIRVDRIQNYFLKSREKKPLSAQEVDTLAKGFLALARMDDGFGEKKAPAPKNT